MVAVKLHAGLVLQAIHYLLGQQTLDQLQRLRGLGGHCIETLMNTFDSANDELPTMFITYTVKSYGPPLAGHKDNHSGMMNPAQMDQFRASMGINAGTEWEPFAGLGDNAAAPLKAFVDASVLVGKGAEPVADTVPAPARLPVPDGAEQSTQAAFGNVLLGLAKSGELLIDRIVTTAPDVNQATNLGAFVNQRGLFRHS